MFSYYLEILNYITKLPNKNASRYDRTPNAILRLLANFLGPYQGHMFKCILDSGKFAEKLCQAIACTLYKREIEMMLKTSEVFYFCLQSVTCFNKVRNACSSEWVDEHELRLEEQFR